MEKNKYRAPHAYVHHAEPMSIVAVSLNMKEAEWKDDVELEAREDNQWTDIWQ